VCGLSSSFKREPLWRGMGGTLFVAGASGSTHLTGTWSATRRFRRVLPSGRRGQRLDCAPGGSTFGLCENAPHATTHDMPAVTHLTFVRPAASTRWRKDKAVNRYRELIARDYEATRWAFTPPRRN